MDAEENEKIKVDIFNNQYLVKCSDNLSEADIRVLSSFVDQLMRQISRKGYDQLTAAILVALNLAEQMYEERKHSSDFLHRLIHDIDEAIKREDNQPNREAH